MYSLGSLTICSLLVYLTKSKPTVNKVLSNWYDWEVFWNIYFQKSQGGLRRLVDGWNSTESMVWPCLQLIWSLKANVCSVLVLWTINWQACFVLHGKLWSVLLLMNLRETIMMRVSFFKHSFQLSLKKKHWNPEVIRICA